MKLPSWGSAVALLFALLGCATGAPSQQKSVTAPGADIGAFATFDWQLPSASPGAAHPPLSIADANIQSAIRKQLVKKGYRETEYQPDFRVGFETAAYIAEKTSNPVRIGVGVGSWGGNVGGGVSTSVPVGPEGVVSAQETRLTIRAVDPKSNREVWVGSATGDGNLGLDAGAVEKTVAATLADFPAKRK